MSKLKELSGKLEGLTVFDGKFCYVNDEEGERIELEDGINLEGYIIRESTFMGNRIEVLNLDETVNSYHDTCEDVYDEFCRLANHSMSKYLKKSANITFKKDCIGIEKYELPLPITVASFTYPKSVSLLGKTAENKIVEDCLESLGFRYFLEVLGEDKAQVRVVKKGLSLDESKFLDKTFSEVDRFIAEVSEVIDNYYKETKSIVKFHKEWLKGLTDEDGF